MEGVSGIEIGIGLDSARLVSSRQSIDHLSYVLAL